MTCLSDRIRPYVQALPIACLLSLGAYLPWALAEPLHPPGKRDIYERVLTRPGASVAPSPRGERAGSDQGPVPSLCLRPRIGRRQGLAAGRHGDPGQQHPGLAARRGYSPLETAAHPGLHQSGAPGASPCCSCATGTPCGRSSTAHPPAWQRPSCAPPSMRADPTRGSWPSSPPISSTSASSSICCRSWTSPSTGPPLATRCVRSRSLRSPCPLRPAIRRRPRPTRTHRPHPPSDRTIAPPSSLSSTPRSPWAPTSRRPRRPSPASIGRSRRPAWAIGSPSAWWPSVPRRRTRTGRAGSSSSPGPMRTRPMSGTARTS